MKTITKELNLLDIEDIENAVSGHLGREVKIGEISCRLAYLIPCDTSEPAGHDLEFRIGRDYCDAYDLFYEEDLDGHYLDGKELSLNEPYLPVEEIFGFDVSEFKSFESYVDGSD